MHTSTEFEVYQFKDVWKMLAKISVAVTFKTY